MKQVLQDLSSGETLIEEVPVPKVRPGHLLIETRVTLVSAGTEKMLVDFGRGNLLQKARQQPERVRDVLEKARSDGVLATYEAVRRKLNEPLPLGYCNVGRVCEVGAGVEDFKVGDRVLSNGKHAGFVCVPKHLCAKIPDTVADQDAVFTVIGAIALQGLRLAAPTLGETFVVVGLGLVGLLAVQLLRANGCRVLGIDPDSARRQLALRLGAAETVAPGEDAVAAGEAFSGGQGVDGVLITASSASSAPVSESARMCRKRGRIVLVGVVGLELNRAEFYEKELSFQVSCSYGPGRYEPGYENRGEDYPVGFVRWTEQRNFAAVLHALESGALKVATLRSHRFAVADAVLAYQTLASGAGLGIVLDFNAGSAESGAAVDTDPPPEPAPPEVSDQTIQNAPPERVIQRRAQVAGAPRLGFLGSGNYASGILMPAFVSAGASLAAVCSADGLSAARAAKKYNFATVTTDSDALLADPQVDAVAICTRHDSHADLVCSALRAGKHVFVEKPLALSHAELQRVAGVCDEAGVGRGGPVLSVGFNRRYAPLTATMLELLESCSGPKAMVMTVNAGAIPASHWSQDHAQGGRIVGEACHFIDLLRVLAGAPITTVQTAGFAAPGLDCADTATINLEFADGSIGSVHYFANGHRGIAKERLEIYCAGKTLRLDNFRGLAVHGWSREIIKRTRKAHIDGGLLSQWGILRSQDKGQRRCARAFIDALGAQTLPTPMPDLEVLLEVSRATIDAAAQLAGDTDQET